MRSVRPIKRPLIHAFQSKAGRRVRNICHHSGVAYTQTQGGLARGWGHANHRLLAGTLLRRGRVINFHEFGELPAKALPQVRSARRTTEVITQVVYREPRATVRARKSVVTNGLGLLLFSHHVSSPGCLPELYYVRPRLYTTISSAHAVVASTPRAGRSDHRALTSAPPRPPCPPCSARGSDE